MTKESAFGSSPSAAAYELQYITKNYSGEAAWLGALAANLSPPDTKSVLDVGCGTGGHLRHLPGHFDEVTGLDISEFQLDEAKKGVPPNVELVRANMKSFELRKKFGTVACLFASIAYLPSPEQLAQGVQSMARHLEPGGILVVEPWLHPDEFTMGGTVRKLQVEQDGHELIRRAIMNGPPPGQEGAVTMDMHFLYSTPTTIDSFRERHTIGLYTTDTYMNALTSAGLKIIDILPSSDELPLYRPWIVSRKPSST